MVCCQLDGIYLCFAPFDEKGRVRPSKVRLLKTSLGYTVLVYLRNKFLAYSLGTGRLQPRQTPRDMEYERAEDRCCCCLEPLPEGHRVRVCLHKVCLECQEATPEVCEGDCLQEPAMRDQVEFSAVCRQLRFALLEEDPSLAQLSRLSSLEVTQADKLARRNAKLAALGFAVADCLARPDEFTVNSGDVTLCMRGSACQLRDREGNVAIPKYDQPGRAYRIPLGSDNLRAVHSFRSDDQIVVRSKEYLYYCRGSGVESFKHEYFRASFWRRFVWFSCRRTNGRLAVILDLQTGECDRVVHGRTRARNVALKSIQTIGDQVVATCPANSCTSHNPKDDVCVGGVARVALPFPALSPPLANFDEKLFGCFGDSRWSLKSSAVVVGDGSLRVAGLGGSRYVAASNPDGGWYVNTLYLIKRWASHGADVEPRDCLIHNNGALFYQSPGKFFAERTHYFPIEYSPPACGSEEDARGLVRWLLGELADAAQGAGAVVYLRRDRLVIDSRTRRVEASLKTRSRTEDRQKEAPRGRELGVAKSGNSKVYVRGKTLIACLF